MLTRQYSSPDLNHRQRHHHHHHHHHHPCLDFLMVSVMKHVGSLAIIHTHHKISSTDQGYGKNDSFEAPRPWQDVGRRDGRIYLGVWLALGTSQCYGVHLPTKTLSENYRSCRTRNNLYTECGWFRICTYKTANKIRNIQSNLTESTFNLRYPMFRCVLQWSLCTMDSIDINDYQLIDTF